MWLQLETVVGRKLTGGGLFVLPPQQPLRGRQGTEMNIYIIGAIVIAFWIIVFSVIRATERAKMQAVAKYRLELKEILMREYLGDEKYEAMRQAFGWHDYYDPSYKNTVMSEEGVNAKEFDIWRAYGKGLERLKLTQKVSLGNDIMALIDLLLSSKK